MAADFSGNRLSSGPFPGQRKSSNQKTNYIIEFYVSDRPRKWPALSDLVAGIAVNFENTTSFAFLTGFSVRDGYALGTRRKYK